MPWDAIAAVGTSGGIQAGGRATSGRRDTASSAGPPPSNPTRSYPTLTAIANDRDPTLAALNGVMQQHRDFLVPEKLRKADTSELRRHPDEAARAELYGTISALRRRLLGDHD